MWLPTWHKVDYQVATGLDGDGMARDRFHKLKWNPNERLILNVIYHKMQEGKEAVRRSEIVEASGLSPDTVWRHLKSLTSTDRIEKKSKGWFAMPLKDIAKYDIYWLPVLENIIEKTRNGKLYPMVQATKDLIYYDISTNKKNKKKWSGLKENLIPSLLGAFKRSVWRSGLKPKDMPARVLFAFVVDTRQIEGIEDRHMPILDNKFEVVK